MTQTKSKFSIYHCSFQYKQPQLLHDNKWISFLKKIDFFIAVTNLQKSNKIMNTGKNGGNKKIWNFLNIINY